MSDLDQVVESLRLLCASLIARCDISNSILVSKAASMLEQSSRWIPVTERLPEQECDCWVHCEDGDEFTLHFDPMIDEETERFGFWEEYFDPVSLGWVGSEWRPIHSVTHWMVKPEFPEPPKEEDDA